MRKGHKLYMTWYNMIARCTKPSNGDYGRYGGRGINVCDRWRDSFKNFLEDMESSHKEGLVLDREDNDGYYSPENCRWITPSQNGKNTRRKTSKHSDVDYVTYDRRSDKWHFKYICDSQEEAEKLAKFINLYMDYIKSW